MQAGSHGSPHESRHVPPMCALTPGAGADSAVLASSLTRVGASPPDRGNADPRSRERIGGGRGESRRVALRAVGAAVWVALAAACFLVFDDALEAIVNALGCAVLVAITVTDLERRIIPNRIVLPALVAALVVQTVREPSVEWVVAAVAAGGAFLLLAVVYPAGLG